MGSGFDFYSLPRITLKVGGVQISVFTASVGFTRLIMDDSPARKHWSGMFSRGFIIDGQARRSGKIQAFQIAEVKGA
jgi:hypothetical protein